jgi:hypothetical protein
MSPVAKDGSILVLLSQKADEAEEPHVQEFLNPMKLI